MNRAGWVVSSLGIVLLAAAVWTATSRDPLEPLRPRRPDVDRDRRATNVVVFLIDTLRADRLGLYGYPGGTSPHIDALGASSVVFDQANAPAPWTLPSVVSLMTSTFPCEHGVVMDGQSVAATLDPLALRLQRGGYATGAFYANAYGTKASGLDRGYDLTRLVPRTDGAVVGPWLERTASPFFLYVHNVEPHYPWAVPRRFLQEPEQLPENVVGAVRQALEGYRRSTKVDFAAQRPPGTTDNSADQKRAMRRLEELSQPVDELYDASVRLADENLGSVVAALERAGLWNDTLFILVSDHGEELGDHGGWQHDQSVYEELVRVPMIIHFPGGLFGGRRVSEIVSLVDVMPTIFDYLGRQELDRESRGQSLLPLIRNHGSTRQRSMVATSERINKKKFYRPYKVQRGDRNLVVRQQHWKAIWNIELDAVELYDLDADPGERNELSTREPVRAAAMRDYARRWLAACTQRGQRGPSTPLQFDNETRENLRALGYVE